MPKSVPRELHHIKKAFINYESGIRLALELPYSNADKEADIFFQLVKTMPKSVPRELHHIKKAFINYESGIRLALELPYSNAKIENLHTHIKALKRIAYGFRSFRRMRTRIFLINHLITY